LEATPPDEAYCNMMTKFLNMKGSADGKADGFKLSEGFVFAYTAMLKAIASNNI